MFYICTHHKIKTFRLRSTLFRYEVDEVLKRASAIVPAEGTAVNANSKAVAKEPWWKKNARKNKEAGGGSRARVGEEESEPEAPPNNKKPTWKIKMKKNHAGS